MLSFEKTLTFFTDIKKSYSDVKRTRCIWISLLKSNFLHEDVLDNVDNPNKQIVSSIRPLKKGHFAKER